MIDLLLALLGWVAAATALTVVLARALRVRDLRDPRGSLGAPHRTPAPTRSGDGVVIDLTAPPAQTHDPAPAPDGGPADLPRTG